MFASTHSFHGELLLFSKSCPATQLQVRLFCWLPVLIVVIGSKFSTGIQLVAHVPLIIHVGLYWRLVTGGVLRRPKIWRRVYTVSQTRSSAIAEGPREALVSRNFATTKHLI